MIMNKSESFGLKAGTDSGFFEGQYANAHLWKSVLIRETWGSLG